jgi:hypothetical protein
MHACLGILHCRLGVRKKLQWLSGVTFKTPEDQQLHCLLPGGKPSRGLKLMVSDILSAAYLPLRSPQKLDGPRSRLHGADKRAALARPYDVGQDAVEGAVYRSIEDEEDNDCRKRKEALERNDTQSSKRSALDP